MLIESAIGDAFGACYEWGLDSAEIAEYLGNRPLAYEAVQPGLIPPGNYTDDTQMTLAIVEALLANDFTKESLADRFVDCYHRDERRGYTTAFQCILMNTHSGKELLSKIGGDSDRSGAAMRAAPLGAIKNIQKILEYSDIQASVTHNSVPGKESARMVSLMAHYAANDYGPLANMDTWLNSFVWTTDIFQPWPKGEKVDVKGVSCVRAARTAIYNNNSLTDILRECISFGGDTDTVACIAMGIASNSPEIKQDLPDNLYSGLENKKYGKDYLLNLDKELSLYSLTSH